MTECSLYIVNKEPRTENREPRTENHVLVFLRRVRRLLTGDSVRYRGVTLPATYLRLGGSAFHDNAYFLASAQAEANRLHTAFGLTSATPILDVGCGVGRLPIGILSSFGPAQAYCGIDVSARSIRWCQRHISRHYPGFRFLLIDAKNSRYNPDGRSIDSSFMLPLPAGSFEVISLYSVFSHMVVEDVRAYLREFGRILQPEGKVFLTAFVEDDVPDMVVNPPDYGRPWQGQLHCVRYDRQFFEALLAEYGFGIDRLVYGQETDGQSALYLSRR